MAKKRTKQASGGARLKASGKRPVLLGLSSDDHAKLLAAAESEHRPLTQFLVHHGLVAAEKILNKNADSP